MPIYRPNTSIFYILLYNLYTIQEHWLHGPRIFGKRGISSLNPNISREGNCDTCNWVINRSRHWEDWISLYIWLQLPSRGQWNPETETMARTLDLIKETAWLSDLSHTRRSLRLSHVSTMYIDTTLHCCKRTRYFTRYEISFPMHQNWLDTSDLSFPGCIQFMGP